MNRSFPLVAALSLALALASPAHAAWPGSPLANLPVCVTSGSQWQPLSVPDGAGGAIVVWQDDRSGSSADLYATRVLASGAVDPTWPANGRALCSAANQQYLSDVVPDGAGGAIAVWSDLRSVTSYDVYAQHVLASGAVDPAWPADGRLVCGLASSQYSPRAAVDGAGGLFVTWYESRGTTSNDVWAHHVLGNGALDPAWPADGIAVSAVTGLQSYPEITAGAPGSAIVTWRDTRGTSWDIYAHRVVAGVGVDPAWPADGRLVCAAAGQQDTPRLVPDGAGGAVIGWRDYRSAVDNDVYAMRVLASGVCDPAWPVDGRAVCTATGGQQSPRLLADDSGGAFLVWEDMRSSGYYDLYAMHVLGTGACDPAWPVNGTAVSTAAEYQTAQQVVGDGAGGLLVCWLDSRPGTEYDVYAQHLFASGSVDPTWPVNGRAVTLVAKDQSAMSLVADGRGGAIAAWTDTRNGTASDLYAQRVAPFGQLGSPEPELVAVQDVPNDQGGRVKLSWNASPLDPAGSPLVTGYDVLRSVPPLVATARQAAGGRVLRAGETFAARPGDVLALATGATTTYWELLTTVPALRYVSGYSWVAPTTSDSLPGSNPLTAFLVCAHDDGRSQWWLSSPRSGYSVDDLAPAAPAPFTAQYAAGATQLHWEPNVEADLAGYRLHRGDSPGFVPGPDNLVGAPADTGWVDAGAAGRWYKLAAVDVHGNVSAYASLGPGQVTGVEDGPGSAALALAAPMPSPARGGTTLRFTLPRAGRVSLGVLDAAGRQVRTVLAESRPAGAHTATWDLRDGDGHAVAAGVYFVRLEFEGRTQVRRVIALR